MKFRMVELGYRSTPDYLYDYRIELLDYGLQEREDLTDWLRNNNIPYTAAGPLSSVLYMRKQDVDWFALRWSS